mgnify:FL=1|jgi:zinc D-Ala-D-Ala carboxypeptidase|tara:strand:+ start:563 stop:973 length:411 start_codon:yes stop_codon:yes gene_type:complete
MIYTRQTWPEGRWPNFSFDEAACQETGECDMDPEFMDILQGVRIELGAGMNMTSMYRSPRHSIEAAKDLPGTHTTGKAGDVACYGIKAHLVLQLLMPVFNGIGIKQSGPMQSRFIHFDLVEDELSHVSRPYVWSYS